MEKSREIRLKKAIRLLAVLVASTILLSVLGWGVASEWGASRFIKINHLGSNGDNLSAVLCMPRNVDDDHPAPVVVSAHGSSCQGYHELPFGIEYARRGYVTLLIDYNGSPNGNSGESDVDIDHAVDDCMQSWIDYALSQKWCDGRIVIEGMSNGGTLVRETLEKPEYTEHIEVAIDIVCFSANNPYIEGVNRLALSGNVDQYGIGVGDSSRQAAVAYTGLEDAQINTTYGSFEDNTAFRYALVHGGHSFIYMNPLAHREMYDFVGQAVPTNTTLAPNNFIFGWFFVVEFFAILSFFMMLAVMAYALTLAPGIYEVIHNAVPEYPVYTGKKMAKEILFSFLVGFFGLCLISKWVVAGGWRATYFRAYGIFNAFLVNPVVFALFGIAIFNFVLTMIRNRKLDRPVNAADFAQGGQDEARILNAKRLGYSLFVGGVVTMFSHLWMDVLCKTTGLCYTVCALGQFTRFPYSTRFVRSIPYWIMFAVILTMNSMGWSKRRLKSTGNEVLDNCKYIAVNVFITVLPYIVVMAGTYLYCFLTNNADPLIPTWLLDSMVRGSCSGFILIMGSVTGINTYLYRKTGNAVVGNIVTTLVIGGFIAGGAYVCG